jgi:hypothetical protein
VICGLTAIVLLTTVSNRSQAADRVSDLLGWVPDQANAALFIDADVVQKSAIAVKDKWGTGNQPTLGLDSLPPNVSKLVDAAQISPGGGMAWEVMVAAQRKPVAEADLIRRTGGTRDTIAGRSVVVTPRYGIVVNLAPGVSGAYQPPNRQDAGRWLRSTTGKLSPSFSAYLKQAADTVGPNAPVVMAFDTLDVLDVAGVKARLAKATSLKGKPVNLDPLAEFLASLRGVTVTIRVTDRLHGEMRLEFERPADSIKDVAKPLLLEILERLGLHSEEMDAWTASVDGKVVTFGGELTLSTANLLLSPFLRPSASGVSPGDEPPPSGDVKAQASLKYFQTVEKKIREVRASKNPNFPKLANTFNCAARQIDDLPILNVDDELLDWGNSLTATFRTMAIVAQAAGGQIDLLEANKMMVQTTTPNYYYGSAYGVTGGYWGGAGYGYSYAVPSGTTSTGLSSNYGAVGNLQTMTNQQEYQYRMNTWKNIESSVNDVRRKMVKKYGIEF